MIPRLVSKMHSRGLLLWCVITTAILSFTSACSPPTPGPIQAEFDRFADYIASGMWAGGRVSCISAKPNAPDEALITAAVHQLNEKPEPIKEWYILKEKRIGPDEFNARFRKKNPQLYPPGIGGPTFPNPIYLIAVIDSDQGHKIIAINKSYGNDTGIHWARMYNCDANFSSTQAGGTALIR